MHILLAALISKMFTYEFAKSIKCFNEISGIKRNNKQLKYDNLLKLYT